MLTHVRVQKTRRAQEAKSPTMMVEGGDHEQEEQDFEKPLSEAAGYQAGWCGRVSCILRVLELFFTGRRMAVFFCKQ